ncbi:MAG: PH domain-containing protein [Bacilli bacterium]|nr:PH domain-containing protein [Bacilli bacterium]
MSKCYKMVKRFKEKYPTTIAFRLKQHCKIIDMHLNPGEEIIYAFAAQKNESALQIFNTNVIALTNKRIMIATKRVIWGYFFISITPDMFNDVTICRRVIWGDVSIDTIKEVVNLSNIDPKALPEIETIISEYMMEEKQKYAKFNKA